jgi:hypothetical protein
MREPNDWRLTGQEKYLKGKTLVLRAYRQNKKNPNWDHDHCDFCGETFSLSNEPGALKQGYATQDDYHWVCPACFQDFKDLFEWQVIEAEDA